MHQGLSVRIEGAEQVLGSRAPDGVERLHEAFLLGEHAHV